MGLIASRDQAGGDVVLAVRVQELQAQQPNAIRAIAKKWEEGLRGLIALVGAGGLVVAPLSMGDLSDGTRIIVGVLLAVVLLTALGGVVLMMTAAHGSVRAVEQPQAITDLKRLQTRLSLRRLTYFRWGRGLAIASLVLFAAGLTVAWVNPFAMHSEQFKLTTVNGVQYCGAMVDASPDMIALMTTDQGRVDVEASSVRDLDGVSGCPG